MKKGFTLIELLAVIVILAIILAIAIPSISNIINNAKLNNFKASSDMLKKAAMTYIGANNIAIASGTTTYILYSDIKSAGYIGKVSDPTSNNECLHSGVYVTNTGGNYTYKGALACDNYLDIDAYNLITNSDFSNGTVEWLIYYGTPSISNNIVSITGNGSNSRISITTQSSYSAYVGHTYYIRCRTRVIGTASNRLYLVDSLNQGGAWKTESGQQIDNPSSGNWYNLSKIFIVPSSPTGIDNQVPQILVDSTDASAANGKVLEVDGNAGVYTIDLTSIYGAGNEPTAAQMDAIMNNMRK